MAQVSVVVEKEGKRKDIRPEIESISLAPSTGIAVLEVTLQNKEEVRARIQDVIEMLFEIRPKVSAFARMSILFSLCPEPVPE